MEVCSEETPRISNARGQPACGSDPPAAGLGEGRALEGFWEKVLRETLFSPAHE